MGFRSSIRLSPKAFRGQYGTEMEELYRELASDGRSKIGMGLNVAIVGLTKHVRMTRRTHFAIAVFAIALICCAHLFLSDPLGNTRGASASVPQISAPGPSSSATTWQAYAAK